ncbi:MAG: RrF2 family transcriptional regulator [Clostridiaceae bacterium]|jgi:Rrf2 family protein|nr:RrF2 family transcriptional regulator [Clostridiaceae bacterium]
MMISTRGRYALRMMLDLAEHSDEGYVALKDIALRQDISKKYLEQIIPVLNRSGLLQTSRGFQGGYRLIKKPSEYTVLEILTATEGSLAPVSCLESEENNCPRKGECLTLPVWQGLKDAVENYLGSITLEDVLSSAAGGSYVI